MFHNNRCFFSPLYFCVPQKHTLNIPHFFFNFIRMDSMKPFPINSVKQRRSLAAKQSTRREMRYKPVGLSNNSRQPNTRGITSSRWAMEVQTGIRMVGRRTRVQTVNRQVKIASHGNSFQNGLNCK